MVEKKLRDLLKNISYERIQGSQDLTVKGVSHDSRSTHPGYLYVAIPGENYDGHDFISEAAEKGANVIVGEKPTNKANCLQPTYVKVPNSRKALAEITHTFFGEPTSKLNVIGVTGTNGKTTTAHLIKQILGKESTGLISTINYKNTSGREAPVTTPESPEINSFAKQCLNEGKRNLVLEVSSHSLKMKRVTAIDFNSAVFTNLSRDHLDFHQSLEDYKREKLKLFQHLSEEDVAILNADEDFSTRISKETKAKVHTYGLSGNVDLIAEDISKSRHGLEFILRSNQKTEKIRLNFHGLYNVYNALAATTAGLSQDIDLKTIARRISRVEGLPGRMEKIELKQGIDVYIDFAHNPGALKNALKELGELYPQICIVFGCGGNSDRGKRPQMGKIAGKYADKIVLTSDNPKNEDRMKILKEIEQGIKKGKDVSLIPERKKAIEVALKALNPGNCLLVAGKGHEQFQVVDEQWIKYNDKEFVKKLAAEISES